MDANPVPVSLAECTALEMDASAVFTQAIGQILSEFGSSARTADKSGDSQRAIAMLDEKYHSYVSAHRLAKEAILEHLREGEALEKQQSCISVQIAMLNLNSQLAISRLQFTGSTEAHEKLRSYLESYAQIETPETAMDGHGTPLTVSIAKYTAMALEASGVFNGAIQQVLSEFGDSDSTADKSSAAQRAIDKLDDKYQLYVRAHGQLKEAILEHLREWEAMEKKRAGISVQMALLNTNSKLSMSLQQFEDLTEAHKKTLSYLKSYVQIKAPDAATSKPGEAKLGDHLDEKDTRLVGDAAVNSPEPAEGTDPKMEAS